MTKYIKYLSILDGGVNYEKENFDNAFDLYQCAMDNF
jgi:hypothetical protein